MRNLDGCPLNSRLRNWLLRNPFLSLELAVTKGVICPAVKLHLLCELKGPYPRRFQASGKAHPAEEQAPSSSMWLWVGVGVGVE